MPLDFELDNFLISIHQETDHLVIKVQDLNTSVLYFQKINSDEAKRVSFGFFENTNEMLKGLEVGLQYKQPGLRPLIDINTKILVFHHKISSEPKEEICKISIDLQVMTERRFDAASTRFNSEYQHPPLDNSDPLRYSSLTDRIGYMLKKALHKTISLCSKTESNSERVTKNVSNPSFSSTPPHYSGMFE